MSFFEDRKLLGIAKKTTPEKLLKRFNFFMAKMSYANHSKNVLYAKTVLEKQAQAVVVEQCKRELRRLIKIAHKMDNNDVKFKEVFGNDFDAWYQAAELRWMANPPGTMRSLDVKPPEL